MSSPIVIGRNKDVCVSSTVITDSVIVGKDSEERLPIKQPTDTVRWMRRTEPSVLSKEKAAKGGSFLQRFNEIDTSYIEPQKYNFAFMIQNTNTYEVYRLSSSSEQSITFAPEATVRIGPYFGLAMDISGLHTGHKTLGLLA